jgi:tetratricopeptide (TPR) repeat protein
MDDAQLVPFVEAGQEAADVALRLGLPNLASGALDAMNAAWSSRGLYGRVLPIWEQRRALADVVTDVAELGDMHAMGAWTLYELGRYGDALAEADVGIATIAGKEPGMELHARSWRVATLQRLGRWDEALDEYGRIEALLGDRRDDPPYFVMQGAATAALVLELRRDRARSDRLVALMLASFTGQSGRLYAYLLRTLVVRGDLDRASALAPPESWQVHANDAYESRAELVAALGDWDEAAAHVTTMREHADHAGTVALVPFADRLEGRLRLAWDDPTAAATLLERSAERFAALPAPWERALSIVDLARALDALARVDEARTALDDAIATFTELRSVRDLERAREVRDALG